MSGPTSATPTQRRRLVDATLADHGHLDVLVNNAGVTQVIPHADLDAATEEVFRRILDVNLIGTYELTKLALPHLPRHRRRRGGQRHVDRRGASHGQLDPLRRLEGGPQPPDPAAGQRHRPEVRINAVAPGLVRTPWTADWGPLHDAMARAGALGRSAEPDDIAAAIPTWPPTATSPARSWWSTAA